ncbi:uncharacterized protein B0H64DRAFT_439639 [Chaetomium fimeti]|uniref:Uncharacterized protein n=1 Tax=Chaetomium fimeti TaxID=1854472 RepID=A0AAE0HMF9_9PEZI|nr:hypothetical protein B0H64DRAFT_439639 [Chaetomium fimeti]
MTDRGTQTCQGFAGPDPALLEVLRRLATTLDDLRPFLRAPQPPLPSPAASPPELLDPSIRIQTNNKANVLRDTVPVVPTAGDILRCTAPTAARLRELVTMVSDERNLKGESRAYCRAVSKLAAFMDWEPQAFGNLEMSGDDGVLFDWRPDGRTWLQGAAHDLGADGYPTSTSILDGRGMPGSIERPAHGKTWLLRVPYRYHIPADYFLFTVNLLHHAERASFRGVLLETFGQRSSGLDRPARAWRLPTRLGSLVPNVAEVLVLQLHLRFFVWEPSEARRDVADAGCRPWVLARGRERVKLNWLHDRGFLIEKAVAVCVTLYLTRDAPYTILALTDTDEPAHPAHGVPETGRQAWEANGIVPSGRCTGVSHFLALSLSAVGQWEAGWKGALGTIDGMVTVNLGDTVNDEVWGSYLFDDSFRVSRLYFTILETLRVSRGWVTDMVDGWDSLREQWTREVRPSEIFDEADWRAAELGWDAATRIVHAKARLLIDRIDRKAEEIKGLRDGLFNATSLREATKGIELNRAVYVFTVVTVIYTPISFLATFFALPFLNNSGDDVDIGVPRGFTTSFIVVPLVTYLASLAVACYFHAGARRFLWAVASKMYNLPREAVRWVRSVRDSEDGYWY